jgi:hypothetical protein
MELKGAMTRRGQALIEAIAVMIPLALVFFGFLLWIYVVAVSRWCDYWVYRATICLAQNRQRYECQREMEDKVNVFVPRNLFRVNPGDVWKSSNHASASVRLMFMKPTNGHGNYFERRFEYEQQIRADVSLPLPTR